ncbi:butyrophilin subfamily 3 member A3-like isoform X2 [Melanotaenia boesemani]|uniref:butyrophilin subfamily 3 member A3-like isoform X2 n=1 Tax=Melanotaenia boesemani TaxID=1250792 RepID=UPI001C05A0C2|nr:butyrophilin subfamily 3 member A3-like isoform X2 [Melanotaenia boesemani]
MSFATKASHENDQEKTETQEDDELNTEDSNSKSKDFPKTSQTSEKKTISPLTLFKKDFCQFKEDVIKVFKDKDVNPRTNQSAEKLISPLTLLKEDLSTVFKIGLSKEGDEKEVIVKEDSSNTSKAKTSKTERAEKPLKSLFGRDGNLLKIFKDKKSKEQAQDDFRNSRKKNKKRDDCEESKKMNHLEHMMHASNTAVTLSSRLTLFNPTDNLRNQLTEDRWSLKNFAFYLTLDPNTANSEIYLSESNRRATRLWLDQQTLEHPERFEYCPQVLCREGLLDSVYWEVVWTGGADIGVTYNSISRDGDIDSCLLGHNEQSWSLECSEGSYTPCHNRKRFKSSLPNPFTHRVGVYLNWPAGSLSFYCVSQDTMVHLHTFTTTFTEPLYPGFWVWAYHGSVTLCQVELDWERLLQ